MATGPEPIGPPKLWRGKRTPPKSTGSARRSGCRVALYTLLGVGLLVVVVTGIATWSYLQTEQGQKLIEVAKQSADWMAEASQAPGTAELRSAGCQVALVSEMSEAVDLLAMLVSDEEREREMLAQMESAGSLQVSLLVICTLPRKSPDDPDCGGLARTYGTAVPSAPGGFFLVAIRQGDAAPSCQAAYAGDGSLTESPQL